MDVSVVFSSIPVGWKIVSSSITRLFGNLFEAIRFSFPYIALLIVLKIFPISSIDVSTSAPAFAIDFPLLLLLFEKALTLIVLSRVAVMWHRFLLSGAEGGTVFSTWIRVWSYFKAVLYICFMALVVVIVPASIVGLLILLITGNSELNAIVMIYGFGTYAWYNLMGMSLVLPARALGKQMSIDESYSETKKHKGLLLFVGTTMLLVIVLGNQFFKFMKIDDFAFSIPSLIFEWLSTMTSISILTTLYGFIIEERSLD